MPLQSEEIQRRWRETVPIRGVAFLLDDEVVVLDDAGRATTGTVVSLRAIQPEPEYELRLVGGEKLVRKQSALGSMTPDTTGENIAWIQKWYASQCDDDWEHGFGPTIGTIDNPGWRVEIDLRGTDLEGKEFEPVHHLEPERAWISCKVVEGKFMSSGGPHMLGKLLDIFVRWAQG